MAGAAPLLPLTSLRFFAAMSVVFYHTYAPFLPSRPLPAFADAVISLGFLGVSFFFVLSGFILAYNYLPARGESAAMRTDSRTFFVARFARIYPLYLLGLLIHAPFVAAYRLDHDPSEAIALGKLFVTFAVNAGLLEGWLQFLSGGWNQPGWSLSAEAFFYALFPFVAPIVWRSRHGDAVLLVLLLALAMIASVLAHTGWIGSYRSFNLEILPLARLPEFLFGIVLARSYRRSSDRSAWPLWVAGALVLCVAVSLQGQIPLALLHYGIPMPAFAMIILGLGRGTGFAQRLLSHPTLVLLGEASYGIYILHVPLAWWCHYLTRESLRLTDIPTAYPTDQPVYYALYLVALIGLSIVSLRCFEEPARRWIRGLDGRIRLGAQAAPGKEPVQEAG